MATTTMVTEEASVLRLTTRKRPLEEAVEEQPHSKILRTKGSSACVKSQLTLIESSNRTVFEKRVWTAICHIPRGSFTTYGILAAHLKSSPRAVGNALRRNPFAPQVPCHRVVATGGALGGFKGKWPRDGEGITIDEKKRLLRGEGVRIDGKGKVVGTPFGGFKMSDK